MGSGASGHDIVQDLYQNGLTDITLVQRSETYVLSFARGMKLLYSPFYDADSASDLDAADSGFSMLPLSALSEASKQAVPLIADEDEQLLRDLEGIGFKLNWDGIFENALRKGAGGYYINQGASELLTQGKVALRRGEVTGFDKTGVVFADGGRLDADVVVLCTGYENMRESARLLLGEDVYAQCTEVFTPDATRGGEHGSLWTDSGHPQLWFMGGSLHYARLYSGKLALRIKAEVEGIVRRSPRPSFR